MTKLIISLVVLVLALIVLGIIKLVQTSKGPAAPSAAPPPEGGADVGSGPLRALTAEGKVWGSGLMLTGGLGAFLMAATLALPVMVFTGGANNPDAPLMVIGLDALGGAAWVMIGLGAIGGARRTNGYAVVVAIFAWIAALFMLAGTVLMRAGGDTGQFFALIGFLAPFVALLFFAIWGLAGVRGFGLGLGLPMGILGILGSVGGIIAMMAVADSYRNARGDAFKLLFFGGIALSFVSLVLGGIGMVGRLRRKPG